MTKISEGVMRKNVLFVKSPKTTFDDTKVNWLFVSGRQIVITMR